MKYIMTIDDSVTIRKSIEFTLKNFEYEVVQSENGAEGLKKIEEIKKDGNDIALVIVDINMPVMDGITFVKEFRKTDKFTPVVILTTESDDTNISLGKQAGASGWLIKPFQTDQLINVVGKLIK